MRRDVLLLEEMIEAAVQAVELVDGVAVEDLAADRIRRDALLWNFTVRDLATARPFHDHGDDGPLRSPAPEP